MEMSKKMFDIHTKMKALLQEAQVLNENGESAKAVAKMNEYDTLQQQYAFEEKLYHAQQSM